MLPDAVQKSASCPLSSWHAPLLWTQSTVTTIVCVLKSCYSLSTFKVRSALFGREPQGSSSGLAGQVGMHAGSRLLSGTTSDAARLVGGLTYIGLAWRPTRSYMMIKSTSIHVKIHQPRPVIIKGDPNLVLPS